ncbi:cation:proton antiporter, partial [bacterium]|nr:cation:proton antiporter [bacterium]
MNWLEQMQLSIHGWGLSSMMVIGLLTLFSFFLGRQMKYIRLPQLIGYMIFGALLGPSFLGILDVNMQDSLEFITDISLGFVALSIGLEL